MAFVPVTGSYVGLLSKRKTTVGYQNRMNLGNPLKCRDCSDGFRERQYDGTGEQRHLKIRKQTSRRADVRRLHGNNPVDVNYGDMQPNVLDDDTT